MTAQERRDIATFISLFFTGILLLGMVAAAMWALNVLFPL